jgi:phage repressor protein C with HTH and peptisase S24 domain
MEPQFRPGDTLLAWRWFIPRVGQVVVVRRPSMPIIKRIKRRDADGFWVEGDNKTQSTDSRVFGIVPSDQIEALVVFKI